jgi:hypothetical protein
MQEVHVEVIALVVKVKQLAIAGTHKRPLLIRICPGLQTPQVSLVRLKVAQLAMLSEFVLLTQRLFDTNEVALQVVQTVDVAVVL